MQNKLFIHLNNARPKRSWRQPSGFAEMASHDLQAPLRKLEFFLDRLISSDADGETDKNVQKIRTCIRQMRSLVDGLAEYACFSAEDMCTGSCDLNSLLQKLMREYFSQGPSKQMITIKELPTVEGDENQLEILFRKILDNSFRFSQPGIPLHIEISSRELGREEKSTLRLPERKYYEISISDNGIGFGEEECIRIFEPLFRIHGKSRFPGNGLGLALVKKITENHGGIVYAKGNRITGARINLVIPENHDR